MDLSGSGQYRLLTLGATSRADMDPVCCTRVNPSASLAAGRHGGATAGRSVQAGSIEARHLQPIITMLQPEVDWPTRNEGQAG